MTCLFFYYNHFRGWGFFYLGGRVGVGRTNELGCDRDTLIAYSNLSLIQNEL